MKQNLTILLIDDDEDDRDLFRESVKEVDETINCILMPDCMRAMEYFAKAENTVPDYIFLDLRIPGYGGKQCLAKLNDNKRLKAVPIIIYTTSTAVEDAEELKALGAEHFISKPTNPQEVYYMISQVINEQWT